MELISDSLLMTVRFGKLVGSLCEPGDLICLGGELGAGKTTLTQSIAEGAGIDEKEYVSSPTYAIFHEYQGTIPFYHMDFYRLGSSEDVLDLGLDEYIYGQGIAVIEWYEKAIEILPSDYLLIRLDLVDEDSRKLSLQSSSEKWKKRISRLAQLLL